MLIQHEETGVITEIADDATIPPRWYRIPEAERIKTVERKWCAACGKWGDHTSGTCPTITH